MTSFRTAGPGDAGSVASLHADSWRRHYRGAYADAYLDGDVESERRAVWSSRLAAPDGAATVVAEDGGRLVGFVHVVFDKDPRWGSLVDNLHVAHDRQRGGIGRALLARGAAAVTTQATSISLYLWVLEQNVAAQAFYRAAGGTCVERALVSTVNRAPERLAGEPYCLRFAWPDASALAAYRFSHG